MAANFTAAHISSPGGREANEDRCAVHVFGNRFCALVADGLGGHLGGAAASMLAAEGAIAAFEAGADARAIAEAANRAVIDQQRFQPDLRHMRTTLVTLLVNEDRRATWAHAGDSRLYWFRDGRVLSRTADHSVPQRLADAGEIAPDQIRFHEDRSCLLRCLGSKPEPNATVSEPALLEPGDAFLLCSDGFWEWVHEGEMENALIDALGRGPNVQTWLDTMVSVLLARAEPGHDNYSAVAVLAGGNSSSPGAPESVV